MYSRPNVSGGGNTHLINTSIENQQVDGAVEKETAPHRSPPPTVSSTPQTKNAATGSSTMERIVRSQTVAGKAAASSTAKNSPLTQLAKVVEEVCKKEKRLHELEFGAKRKPLTERELKTAADIQRHRHEIKVKNGTLADALKKREKIQDKIDKHIQGIEKIEQKIANCHENIERLIRERDAPSRTGANVKDGPLNPGLDGAADGGDAVDLASGTNESPASKEHAKLSEQVDEQIKQLQSELYEANKSVKKLKDERKKASVYIDKSFPAEMKSIVDRAKRQATQTERDFMENPLAKAREWAPQFGLPHLPDDAMHEQNYDFYTNWLLPSLDYDEDLEECRLSDDTLKLASGHHMQEPNLRMTLILATVIHPDLAKTLMRPIQDMKSKVVKAKQNDEDHIRAYVEKQVDTYIEIVSRDQEDALEASFERNPRTKLSFADTKAHSDTTIRHWEDQLRAVVDIVKTNKEELVGEIVGNALSAIRGIDEIKQGPEASQLKAERDGYRERLEEIPAEMEQIYADIKLKKERIKDLNCQKDDLTKQATEQTIQTIPAPAASAFTQAWDQSSGERTKKDCDTKISQYKGQILGLVQGSEDASVKYWTYCSQFDALTESISTISEEIAWLNEELTQKQVEKNEQRLQSEEEKQGESIKLREQLENAWSKLNDPESKQYSVFRKLISPRALTLVMERHLDLSVDDLRDRLKGKNGIDRAAAYDSHGALLKAIRDVHESANNNKRFDQVMAAKSKEEFDAANGTAATKNRICLHQDGSLGTGVNDKNGTKTVKAYQSCYAFEWNEETSSVTLAHLYPLIPHLQVSKKIEEHPEVAGLPEAKVKLQPTVQGFIETAEEDDPRASLTMEEEESVEPPIVATSSSNSSYKGKERQTEKTVISGSSGTTSIASTPEVASTNSPESVINPTSSATVVVTPTASGLQSGASTSVTAVAASSSAEPPIRIKIYLGPQSVRTLMLDPNVNKARISKDTAIALIDAMRVALQSEENQFFGDEEGGSGTVSFEAGEPRGTYHVAYESVGDAITSLEINGPDKDGRVRDVVTMGAARTGQGA